MMNILKAAHEEVSIVHLRFHNLEATNLVGKFTQSVRRIVQDVKDEGTSSGQTKEEVIETNERLRMVRVRLDENYDTAKKSLITLMARYSESKAERNVFTRYALLKAMIKMEDLILYYKGASRKGSILSSEDL
ncbi:jg13108 [Pararge aegeria aegeria]|uniref:Jg13108 protein n=1 Tax=Pararge aegeria aegeria TaxID=348720 RepID=A0A8S4RAE3_9NEOP|nr:jg13108 [Pararge aegeria aegeria]